MSLKKIYSQKTEKSPKIGIVTKLKQNKKMCKISSYLKEVFLWYEIKKKLWYEPHFSTSAFSSFYEHLKYILDKDFFPFL